MFQSFKGYEFKQSRPQAYTKHLHMYSTGIKAFQFGVVGLKVAYNFMTASTFTIVGVVGRRALPRRVGPQGRTVSGSSGAGGPDFGLTGPEQRQHGGQGHWSL